MWRVGLCVVLVTIFIDGSSADTRHGLPERLKRALNTYCPPYPPGPPPAPYPPYWGGWHPRHHHHRHFDDSWEQFEPQEQEQPQEQPQQQPQQQQEAQPNTNANTKSQALKQGTQPCSTCSNGSALSNARSETGSAVAIAIARPKSN